MMLPASLIKHLVQKGWRDVPKSRHASGVAQPLASLSTPFKVLDGAFDPWHPCSVRSARYNDRATNEVVEGLNRIRRGGSESAHKRHTIKNKKLFARDRLRKLLDPGTEEDYLEIAPFAGTGMDYGDIPSAGIVSLIGRIHNKWCSVGCNDATVKGGTSYPITVQKQLRVQDIALQNRLPVIYGVDSGGAFLPLQMKAAIWSMLSKEHHQFSPKKLKADIFTYGGRVFYNEAILSSMGVPQIAIVCGSCTAGGAYVPTMAEEAVILNKSGTIFLGGPPLVLAATGKNISAEDLGGATLHCKVSGCTDHFVCSEDEAWQLGRDIVATLNVSPPEDPTSWEEPLYDPHELSMLAPTPYDSTSYSIKKILARIVDGSRFHEFKALYGPTLITGFSFIKGHLAGILANDGPITSDAALKGAHFISLCQQRDIPLLFLQNVTSDEPSSDPEEGAEVLKARAKMMTATASSTIPKITIIIGSSFGSSNYLMCGRSMDPNFIFSWPLAQIGLMSPEQAARTMKQVVEDCSSEEAMLSEFQRKSSPLYASGRLWDDGIILPHDTRQVLAQCLSIVSQKKYWYNEEDVRSTMGLFRM